MIKEAIDKIIALSAVDTKIIDANGLKHVLLQQAEHMRCIGPPEHDTLSIHTLTGLADWIENTKETPDFIHVVNERQVKVITEADAKFRQREVFIDCEMTHINGFGFGNWYDIDSFIINLQCKFVHDTELLALIQSVSKVSGELVVTAEDDGTAQTVTVKDAIGRLAEQKMNPIVTLRPYRTFAEVEQPQSAFLLRLKKTGGDLPSVALFEADAGQWRNDAISSIASFLEGKKLGVIIA